MSTAPTTQAEQEDAVREEIARLKLDRRRVDNRIRAQRATLRQFEARVSNIIASPARLWLWDFARKKAADCRSLRTERDQLAADLRKAREALKPFGAVCDAEQMRWIRDEQVLELATRAEVPVSEKLRGRDFRAARAALTPDPKDAGGTAKGDDHAGA